MKHPQHIVAFRKVQFGSDVADKHGIHTMSFGAFIERARNSLYIGRRHDLEVDEAFGQMLPYIVLRQGEKVFAYERTKLVGEQRLAGATSIGIGGHVDLSDVVYDSNSIIDIMGTLARALGREMTEEIEFRDADGVNWSLSDLRVKDRTLAPPRFVGIINDTSNEVGRVHYGLLFVFDVPSEYTPHCREVELSERGMLGPLELTDNLENWTTMVVATMALQS